MSVSNWILTPLKHILPYIYGGESKGEMDASELAEVSLYPGRGGLAMEAAPALDEAPATA